MMNRLTSERMREVRRLLSLTGLLERERTFFISEEERERTVEREEKRDRMLSSSTQGFSHVIICEK
jgi:hypothetical protein